jgi:phosphoglycerol geranylgeranyltransferase
MKGKVFSFISEAQHRQQPLFFLLIDPDKTDVHRLSAFVSVADAQGVDGFLVGDSLSLHTEFESTVRIIKSSTEKPVIVFPGGIHQITGEADALLFLSIISGRNPEHLIGQHVIAAPLTRRLGLESLSTAYMLIDSGAVTGTEFMSYSKPIPRHKPEIAVAHGMAAEILGFKLLYLEAGSGGQQTVPDTMISALRKAVELPIIVGGGIRSPEEARRKVLAGASIIVVGNHFEAEEARTDIALFAEAIHDASARQV